jgi:hypothetical protein
VWLCLQDEVQLPDMELDVDLLDLPSSGSCSWLLVDEFGDDEGDVAGINVQDVLVCNSCHGLVADCVM